MGVKAIGLDDSYLHHKVGELPPVGHTGREARTSEVLGDKQKQYNPKEDWGKISLKAWEVEKCNSQGEKNSEGEIVSVK